MIKITENGIDNSLITLEQKLRRNNELVEFLKNYKDIKDQNIRQVPLEVVIILQIK